jgi:hypothetical protein
VLLTGDSEAGVLVVAIEILAMLGNLIQMASEAWHNAFGRDPPPR